VYAAFSKELPADAGAIKAWLPRNRRAEIKKAQRIKEDPAFGFTSDGDIDLFYDVYAGAVKRLGTPVMPRRFLHALKDRFSADAEASLVLNEGKPVAGLFSFWRGDRVMPYFIGGTAAARDIRAYDYLYYMLMKRAVERGVRIFDFGRSKVGSPHFNTKKYWGFDPQPLTYHVALVNAEETPNVNPNNPKFAAFVGLWKHLPTPVANVVGPMLARNFA
ncbi:MAG: GNAT family N-acetyltransferase, partial [Parvularculaceae bacterium]